MITRVNLLEPEKYYHCVYLGTPSNVWLTKGGKGVLHLGTVEKPTEAKYHPLTNLYAGEDCQVREATYEEADWMVRSLAIGAVALRTFQNDYQIF